MRKIAIICCAALAVSMSTACGSAPDEGVGTSEAELSTGEYASKATNIGDAPYIGNWEHNWGYVLGYLPPGGRIYANTVREDSVYGLIEDSGYGGWDHGHHCGWISLSGLRGSGDHSSVADVCPPWNNDFSLANGQPHGLFKPDTVVESDGNVQPAIVLPTCPDLTVYANYDPVSHSFHNPDGVESAGRGTPGFQVPEQAWRAGYSGFGTRFVTADGYAVEIKDTQRGGDVTAFGFMHAACIAGSQVGNPSPVPPPASTCGALQPGQGLGPGESIASCNGQYRLVVQSTDGNVVEYEGGTALWASKTTGQAGDRIVMQTDGNLVIYQGWAALWASHTNGHPGATFALQDDGNIVVYDGSTPLWARFGL